jgi:hypothetical protein
MKHPVILDQVLSSEDREELIGMLKDYKSFEFQPGFSRYIVSDMTISKLGILADKLVPLARKTFNSNTLLPSYTLFSHYEGANPPPSLYRHKDDNACTYTIDLCLYQTEPWDLWVDNKSYTLQENQALGYYGNDQLHWREEFPNPGTQRVAMVFFHFVEPDHWWFTKGSSYLNVIRGQLTEEAWSKSELIRKTMNNA